MLGYGGSVLITSDNYAVGAYPTRVFSVHIISTGTAAVVNFDNGSGGTVYATETGTASTGKTINYGWAGRLFPNGCYVDVDTNTTSVLVTCVREE